MIVRGGENIYPTEIEQYLFRHPHIKNVQVRVFILTLQPNNFACCCFWSCALSRNRKLVVLLCFQIVGVPDERFGEVVCAWITLKEGSPKVTEDDIRDFCKSKVTIDFWAL